MKYLLLFTSLIFNTYAQSQTCILIVYSNDSVVIGADSKAGVLVSSTNNNLGRDTFFSREQCKIQQEKNVFYVASGKWATILLRQAKESISHQKTFKDSIEYFRKDGITELETHLERMRAVDYKTYMEYFKEHIFAHLAFVWLDGKITKGYEFEFKIISDSTEKVKIGIRDIQFQIPQDKLIHIFPLGTYDAIYSIYKDGAFWRGKTLEQAVNQLLNIQTKAAPETVGPPFSIVRVAKNYVKWYKKGKCQ